MFAPFCRALFRRPRAGRSAASCLAATDPATSLPASWASTERSGRQGGRVLYLSKIPPRACATQRQALASNSKGKRTVQVVAIKHICNSEHNHIFQLGPKSSDRYGAEPLICVAFKRKASLYYSTLVFSESLNPGLYPGLSQSTSVRGRVHSFTRVSNVQYWYSTCGPVWMDSSHIHMILVEVHLHQKSPSVFFEHYGGGDGLPCVALHMRRACAPLQASALPASSASPSNAALGRV